MKKLVAAVCIAAIFWFVMFSPCTGPHINFWYVMVLAAGVLTFLSFTFRKDWKTRFSFNVKDVALGIGSAIVLWGIFYLGNEISGLLFDFARPQVNDVYAMKEGQNQAVLALALLFWIGPAEEIFWRGYIQQTLAESKLGDMKAFIVTTLIYAAVHIWAFNFMLFMAALICGTFWGFIYMKNKNPLTVLISHAIWDVAVFILFPIP
jgi:membrane protease YdiL (CAAX protease family)